MDILNSPQHQIARNISYRQRNLYLHVSGHDLEINLITAGIATFVLVLVAKAITLLNGLRVRSQTLLLAATLTVFWHTSWSTIFLDFGHLLHRYLFLEPCCPHRGGTLGRMFTGSDGFTVIILSSFDHHDVTVHFWQYIRITRIYLSYLSSLANL